MVLTSLDKFSGLEIRQKILSTTVHNKQQADCEIAPKPILLEIKEQKRKCNKTKVK